MAREYGLISYMFGRKIMNLWMSISRERKIFIYTEIGNVMTKETFHLKRDHIRLLENINICWNNEEYGAPKVDNDQPLGYSISGSIGSELLNYLDIDARNKEDVDDAKQIYNELDTAMQIVLSNKTFDTGVFEKDECSRNWTRIAVEHDGNCPSCDKRVSLSIASMYGEWKCSECDVTQDISLDR